MRDLPYQWLWCDQARTVMASSAGWLIGGLGLIGLAAPAIGQVSLGASVMTDYRLRGYSLSRSRPAASARIGYDDASGLFIDGSGTVFLAPNDAPRWLGGVVAIGYAKQVTSRIAIDAGVMRLQLSPSASLGRASGYTEVFAGVSGPVVSARIAYSPDYFRPGTSTLYGSVDAVGRHHNWHAFAHIGALTRLTAPPNLPFARTQYDWRIGVGRLLGLADLELALSGGGPSSDYYDATRHSKTAVVGVAKFAF